MVKQNNCMPSNLDILVHQYVCGVLESKYHKSIKVIHVKDNWDKLRFSYSYRKKHKGRMTTFTISTGASPFEVMSFINSKI